MLFKVPVLFISYKRYRTASLVFDEIKKIKPKRLYFASNYPENKKEEKNVKKVQGLLEKINWKCKVTKIFHKKHLPVSKSIPKAINFFFQNEIEGIILEDDCLPSIDFFYYCERMLKKYRTNKKINSICGSRFIRNNKKIYLSKYNHAWGWATWRRSWKNFDPKIKFWNNWKKTKIWDEIHSSKVEKKYWSTIFDLTHKGKINTWDYAWTACSWYNRQLSVIPPVNLINNIGFGPDATWTIQSKNKKIKKFKSLEKKYDFNNIIYNLNYDKKVFETHFNKNNQASSLKIINHLKTLITDPYTVYLKLKRDIKNAKKSY